MKRRDFIKYAAVAPLALAGCLPQIATDVLTYRSEIDMAITNLYARTVYDKAKRNLPIVCLIHGYGGVGADDFAIADLQRIAAYGFFVVAPGMRGWNSASGSKDASGRECWDLYDVVEYVKTNYATYVDPTNIAIVGYSGGGADALGFACKFPDYASVVVDHFGISDYAAWYNAGDAARKALLDAEIGGSPVAVPNNYKARLIADGITNFSGGHLFIYHNPDDTIVAVGQSEAVEAAAVGFVTANYSANWAHGYPTQAGTLKGTEDTWKVPILAGTYPAWTIPAAGTVTVLGYVKTKRFTIWLDAGQTGSATVVYDTAADTYTVTPLTGSMTVTITQGAKTASQTITEATTLTVT